MTRPGRKKTLNFVFDGPLTCVRTRVWLRHTQIAPIIPGDRRRKDGGYDRNFTNTANGRVSIAISRLTDPRSLLVVLHDRLTLWSAML